MMKKTARRIFGVGIAIGAVATAIPAMAQVSSREGIALQNQIADLRQQMAQMQSPGAPAAPASPPLTSAAPSGDLTAQLLDRVSTLEDQNRQMRGELDQLSNQVQQQNAALSKQISDMNFAMQNGQGGSSPSPGAAVAPSATTATSDTPPAAKPAPADPLQAGRAALTRRDYPAAERDARLALAASKTPNAKVDAQYLIAQSLAGQRQYRQSAVAYYDAYTKAPRSARAPDALLGVAATMLALGDKHAACQALDKLHGEFPTPAPRVKNAAQSFATRGGCR